jgi:ferredoxin
MKVHIDNGICIRCGICADTCPEIFRLAEDEDKVIIAFETIPAELEESCRQAASDCAVGAITIVE